MIKDILNQPQEFITILTHIEMSINTEIKEHKRNCRLGQIDKSTVVEYTLTKDDHRPSSKKRRKRRNQQTTAEDADHSSWRTVKETAQNSLQQKIFCFVRKKLS